MDPLIHIVIVLVVVGLILWLIERFIPMAEPIRTIYHVFIAIVAIIYLLKILGIIAGPGLTG